MLTSLILFSILPFSYLICTTTAVELNKSDRNDKYVISSELNRQAALALNVRPPSRAPLCVRRWFMMLERTLIPFFFQITSSSRSTPPDSKLSLCVLWWKAVLANHQKDSSSAWALDSSVSNDPLLKNISYNLLPSFFRVLTKLWFYPRYISAIIEIRSAYLDRAISKVLYLAAQQQEKKNMNIKLRLIVLGAGYDTRSITLLNQNLIQEAIDLDLPAVIDAKTQMLQSPQFQARWPKNRILQLAEFHKVNLNNVDQVKLTLESIMSKQESDNEEWHTIFLLEAVMMYLDEGVPSALLSICRKVLKNAPGSLVFADRLETLDADASYDDAKRELLKYGWFLEDWMLKGRSTSHMGMATSHRS